MVKENLGFKCLNCGFKSDKKKDWVITETDIKCKKCNRKSVYPIDINKGVKLSD